MFAEFINGEDFPPAEWPHWPPTKDEIQQAIEDRSLIEWRVSHDKRDTGMWK
jgi:hypothetical protein